MDEKYIRVATTIYKVVEQPLADGTKAIRRIPWSLSALRQDYGKGHIPPMDKYNGFCTVPSHTHYQKEIDGFYNLYEPIEHEPVEGDFPDIESILQHVFGEQYQLGLDYMQLLYTQPTQKLPILLLVSSERNTGKTTFLNFLKHIFQDNVTFNTNEEFRSQFNADWGGKLLIVVDEVLLDRREDAERLKNLSTAQTYKIEAKGKDKQEVNFFAKFVLCSNNELCPVVIDAEENRYWVRKIHPLKSDEPDFLQKLTLQIPAFLYFLQQRKLSTIKEGRMWFNFDLIRTKALDAIVHCNRDHAEVDMVELIRDIMETLHVEQFSFTPQDLVSLMRNNGTKVEAWQVRKVLKQQWHLFPAPNGLTYQTYKSVQGIPNQFLSETRVGRFYTVTKELLKSLRL